LPSMSANTPYLISAYFDGTNAYLFINGSQVSSFASSGNFNFNKYGLGLNAKNTTATTDLGVYEYGEFVLYSPFPNTSQRQQVEGQLAWKWGIQSSLPSGHPYQNALPSF
jgi:hypothetical protein